MQHQSYIFECDASLNPSLMTGTGTVDCGRGLRPLRVGLVVVRPLKDCENEALVDFPPLQVILICLDPL